MMLQMMIRQPGGPEMLVPETGPVPEPHFGEVLIAQEAVGVNFVDLQHRAGGPYPALPLPLVPGIEAAGHVLAAGPGVTGFSPGDRVAYAGAMPGAYATHAVLPQTQLIRLPDGISAIQAAANLVPGLTARYLVHEACAVRQGDWVLAHAAATGVGRLVHHFASGRGARVIGTSRRPEGRDAILANGAYLALDADAPDFIDRVRKISGGGCRVVYDSLGGPHFERALFCLRARGDLVSYGLAAGPVPPFDVMRLAGYWDAGMAGSLRITRTSIGDYFPDQAALATAAAFLFQDILGGFWPEGPPLLVPLAEAAEAHRLMSGSPGRKIVLIP